MNNKINLPSLFTRVGIGTLLLICGLLVFLLGSNYYDVFPTNQSQPYRLVLGLIFLTGALLTRKIPSLKAYSQLLYAFFIAITTYFLTSWFVVYRDPLLKSIQVVPGTDSYLAAIKVLEALIVIGAILILSFLWGDKPRDLYLKKGRLRLALFIGLCLCLINAATGIMTGAVRGQTGDFLIARLPWAVIYSLANAMMEELLFRGLFMGKMKEVLGPWGAVIITSIIFTVEHSAASYLNLAEAMIFQIVLFPMALLFAYLIQKTDNLWGSTLYHTGSDIFLFYLVEF
jgi:membrane protease YdiL (CAAX protease family)